MLKFWESVLKENAFAQIRNKVEAKIVEDKCIASPYFHEPPFLAGEMGIKSPSYPPFRATMETKG